MLNMPFAAYRSHHQQVGPWHLRLVAWIIVGLAAGAAYWAILPRIVVALITRQWF